MSHFQRILYEPEDVPDSRRKPAFGIYSNRDTPGYMYTYNIRNVHNHVVYHGGMLWGGFQGCPCYHDSRFIYTGRQAERWASRFPRVDVLLLHTIPAGMLDDPSDAFRQYVLKHNPLIVLVGHQRRHGTMNFSETTIHCTYGGRLIQI
ncbi:MAG: hypothetical protein JXB30_16105 [Anaerolineae bacterium]|nr:hypothetical protein [Anaerolineae bacterium]